MFSFDRETILMVLVVVALIGAFYNFREVQSVKKMLAAPTPVLPQEPVKKEVEETSEKKEQ